MGGLFAPSDRGAAKAWQDQKFNVNAGNIDQTRQPVGFNTGNAGGMVDPRALQVMAQGGPYDFDARRNSIAAAVQQQQAAAPAFQLKYLPNGQLDQNDPGNIAYYYQQMGGGGGAAPAYQQPAAQQPVAQQPAYQQPAYQPPADDPYNTYAYGGSA
jgi:hypothetical protein